VTAGPAGSLLPRLAAQFAAAVADGSERYDTPGFRVHIWPAPDPFHRNVAIPVGSECAQPEAVADMLRLFAECGRAPTVEYFAELWPTLAPALAAHGLELDACGDVMVTAPPARPATPADSARLLTADDAPALMHEFLSGANAVFGQRAALLAPGEPERFAAGLRRGTLAAAAVVRDREPVAGASLIRAGTVAELAGVWTRPKWRRQGHARACCRLLLQQFFADGGELVWLSVHEPEAGSLYADLGFRACGTQLNFVGSASP
jgi:ribosomal protein S18 acetylase RimI-like enzyme